MKQRKIVLIGKTGDGKSSTGNTILRKNVFSPKASANAVTPEFVQKDGLVDGRKITVIDTPGFFDTDRDDKEIKSALKALINCAPSIDAFVMVLRVGRYTRHEKEVFQQFLNTVKEDALKHTVILFTFGEQLEDQTIKEFVKVNAELQNMVDKCGGRCHVIDNKYWNNNHSEDKSDRVQVKNLMETIDNMVKENGCYSNELLQMFEEKVQEEMNKGNSSPEAKRIVYEKLLKQFVGTTTGMLLGALLGIAVPSVLVVAVLQQYCPLKKLIKAKAPLVFGAAGGAGTAAGTGGAGAVAGGAGAAVEIGAVTGGAGAVAGGAGAAVEIGAVTGGTEAVSGGAGAAASARVGAGSITAGVLKVSALAGAVIGGVTGWEAAKDADSVCDAMNKAATANCEVAQAIVKKTKELFGLNNKCT